MPNVAYQERLADARGNIQANLVRAAKYGPNTRDWSLFYFFRVMAQTEVEQTLARAGAAMAGPAPTGSMQTLLLDLEQPSLVNAGLVRESQRAKRAGATPAPAGAAAPDERPDPAGSFLGWLKVLASADKADLVAQANTVAARLGATAPGETSADDAARFHQLLLALGSDSAAAALERCDINVNVVRSFLCSYARVLATPELYRAVLQQFGATAAQAGAQALQDGLCGVTFYELLRQGAPAFTGDGQGADTQHGILRGESHRDHLQTRNIYDPVPINLAFTHCGLEALKLDPATLASFPEPFRQGMAARATRLNDTGPSAPPRWQGDYGLPSMHGFFTGGFFVGPEPVPECVWARLRAEIADFNDPRCMRGQFLRRVIGILFRQLGLEIIRIELGQDPYDVVDGAARPLPDRMEHFGFRDGLSQPFADLGLGVPPPGGGRPDVDGTWSPVAPGEIYLDLPDEDGAIQQLPVGPQLRCGSTYIVFRKLEQDVSGFRTFLEQQRPQGKPEQTRLAAQFVGRWPNGTPLVVSPDAQRNPRRAGPAALNDFRYAQDDPYGAKCPLGAHIRRTNPRDTGGRDEVKRHRVLRRGISYGGSRLPDGSLGDGASRGLLFIAVNARIDLQFEVVQADWINSGELLGQAGLARCPLVGGNEGGLEDNFLEAGAVAPVSGLPRFVVTRGGDYFFAPGVGALRLLAGGCGFAPAPSELPFGGFAMGGIATPGLFDAGRLARYGEQILGAPPGSANSSVRIALPLEPGNKPQSMLFVGQHADVSQTLSDQANAAGKLQFSVSRYQLTADRITRGYDFLVGTETVGATAAVRQRMYGMLGKAWQAVQPAAGSIPAAIEQITAQRLSVALQRTGPVGRIDLVHDLAVQAAYGVVTDLLGVPGPEWLTELAPSLPFGSQHVTSLPADWLAAVKGGQPQDPGMTSMQIWSALIMADMLGNLQSDHEAEPFSRQAGSEMLSQIDAVLAAAWAKGRPAKACTLVDAFVQLAPGPDRGYSRAREAYFRLAAVVLLEAVGDTISAIPATFGHVLDYLLSNRIDLARLAPLLDRTIGGVYGFDRLIYEAERLNPVLPVLMRQCVTATTLPSGAAARPGDWVAAIVQAANVDPRAFNQPLVFSLDPFLAGQPARPPLSDYLAFGAQGGNHACWGRARLAMPVLTQCVKYASKLQNLRKVAGPAGAVQSLAGVTIGLPARFTPASADG